MIAAQRPAIALGLLALAVAIAGLAITWPMSRALDLRRAIATGEERLATVRRAIRDGTGLAEMSTARLLVNGGSTGRAAAELQLQIGAAAKAQNADLRSVQVLTPMRDGDLTEIALEVNLQATTSALRNVVHLLETSLPLLIVDEISIRGTTTAADNPSGRPMMLDVNMKVRGFASASDRP